jgi:flagellar protein FliL
MAKKTDDTTGEAGGKKGKNNLIPAVVVAVGLLGGAYFMSSSGGKAPAAAAAPASPAAAGAAGTAADGTAAAPVPEGPAVSTGDAITLNMADGRFLKVQIALALAKGGKADAWTVSEYAKSLDATISYFGGKTYAELSAPGARDVAKAELGKKLSALYEGKVVGVYFTQFVMQ